MELDNSKAPVFKVKTDGCIYPDRDSAAQAVANDLARAVHTELTQGNSVKSGYTLLSERNKLLVELSQLMGAN